ncbi:Abhydrolase domain-containing protein FAM108C1 [Pteropus alecto]|uniref:Alpha/beta hydrolase domain-containing protein 17C n=1 Tax=Pteropus alecto TaxID=9402 RepID=L5L3M7_PTEAL|nr:Abhydrolase domain-containing protein FAM108C1 [Pteropus alecto]
MLTPEVIPGAEPSMCPHLQLQGGQGERCSGKIQRVRNALCPPRETKDASGVFVQELKELARFRSPIISHRHMTAMQGQLSDCLVVSCVLQPLYGVSPENIILYGQSIGTVPTVDLASRYECAAVILHSPLTSGLRVAFPDTRKTYCFDAFPSIDKISKVTSPVLVIHGTEDEVIDFSHGLAMYERCPRAVEPLWVEGAGHNDIELYAQYLERLKQFISHELPNS